MGELHETLDFLLLQTVDYSGGVIISDWYSENTNKNESLKLLLDFYQMKLEVIVPQNNCT